MAFEMTCGQCHGPLLVEAGGVIVECPLCGAHLSIPVDAEEHENQPAPFAAAPSLPLTPGDASTNRGDAPPSAEHPQPSQEAPPIVETEMAFVAPDGIEQPRLTDLHLDERNSQVAVQNVDETANDPVTDAADMPAVTIPLKDSAGADVIVEIDDGDALQVGADTQIHKQLWVASPPNAPETANVVPPLDGSFTPPFAAGNAAKSEMAAPEESRLPKSIAAEDAVSRQLFVIVASYASAVTLVLLYFLYAFATMRQHALESLPDLEPPIRPSDGQVGMRTAAPDATVARGHVLQLGESRRFGNVRVTPLQITRGPLHFVHAFGDRNAQREPTKPVLKLWLRFENVSADQTFPPLTPALVFKRKLLKDGRFQTNNFIAAEAERSKKGGELSYVYDLSEFSEFQLAGQDLSHLVKPGEIWETYVPSEENVAAQDGVWIWRVWFRKGYHPQSRRGVTTIIDVRFHPASVLTEVSESIQAS